jgi:hypothetical protein
VKNNTDDSPENSEISFNNATKKDSRTGKRKNLGTFNSKGAAKKHERAVQYFKRH